MNETKQQRKEREHQEDLQRLKELRPIDDDFMRCLFKDNIPLTEQVLRIIIGKKSSERIKALIRTGQDTIPA